ncbi:MAG: UDP-2,3-diacylglucosamine diphosphatase LpxI [Alphaproteobacteria bacterium]|nr:UDP-2,3-diacylglucosamine diphosphatase LpxI [Alphaproteobacteria bacterium]OJV13188.1 MAG: hypothetical protein BGO27_00085 [Alphaproteobacteria bacterium 33-17]
MLTNNEIKKIGIIAGSGDLPYILIKELKKKGIEPYVVALNYGLASFLLLNSVPFIKCSITEVKKTINFFKSNNVNSLILLGKITRPNLFGILNIDSDAKILLKQILSNIGGDDKILSQIVDFFEQNHGFEVVGAQAFIENHMFAGTINDITSELEKVDIQIGREYLQTASKFDIGQAVVVRNKQIICVEGADGTDAMLERAKSINSNVKYGGVMVKMPKSGQNLKVDLPTIGIKTIKNCFKAKIKAVAIEKSKCFILEKEEITDFAGKNAISIVSV